MTLAIDGTEIARSIPFSKYTNTGGVWLGRRARTNARGGGLEAPAAKGAWLTSNATSIRISVFLTLADYTMRPSFSLTLGALPVRRFSRGGIA